MRNSKKIVYCPQIQTLTLMKKALLLVLLCSFLISCKSYIVDLALNQIGVFDEKAKLHVFSNGEKQIVIIGMHHVGKQAFYDDVKFKVDSLRNLNFHFFYETVQFESDFPEENREIYNKKYRKLSGYHIPGKGYLDPKTNKIAGKIKVNKKHKLVNQPKYPGLGINQTIDEKADLPINILIDKYEEKFGTIELNKCDIKTSLKENYKCSTWKNGDKDYITMELRNQEIANRIVTSEKTNIAIVYGKAHIEGVFNLLHEKDSTWIKITSELEKPNTISSYKN